ncbi:MAG: hypothetical protein HXY34_03780 [Candidatus Thorarchaeota archaeon]|nr:hypothetical protein [Candidatus Thorarchaeota archaeon]
MDNVVRNWTIDIVLVNYDEDVINETLLTALFPTQRVKSTVHATMIYNIEYEVMYADQSYYEALRSVAIAHSQVGDSTGTALDADALRYQRQHPDQPQTVFHSRGGRSIDADAVESWLIANPAVEPPGLGYILYILNFTEFDTPDHVTEHWYDYHPADPDTNQPQTWFRLEWDNALNPNVMLEYPGFGGKQGNIYVLDPSADQWYLKWASIWWDDSSPPAHTWNDLDEYASTLDLETTTGKNLLTVYVANYASDIINYLLMPYQHYPTAYVNSGLLRALVFAMDVSSGVSVNSLRWVTSAQRQKAHLTELLPFIPWTVQVDFVNIDNEPEWKDLFWDYSYVDEGVTWCDGYGMFDAIYDQMRPDYVNTLSKDINVFGVVFIKKNMVMYTPSGTFTGLGGGGQTVIWKSWERYYFADGVTPKSGISSVQLHETMHAIGIMHTWNYNHYVGDFCSSPMTYYGYYNGTSVYDRNWVQCTYLDQMESLYYQAFSRRWQSVEDGANERTLRLRDAVIGAFTEARALYNQMDWMGCYRSLLLADELGTHLDDTLTDNTPPVIESWEVSPDTYNASSDYNVTAVVLDSGSGVMNVTAVLLANGSETQYPCTRDGARWSTRVPRFTANTSQPVTIRFLAMDNALNLAESVPHDLITGSGPSPIWWILEPPVVALTAGVGAVAVVLLVARRRHVL